MGYIKKEEKLKSVPEKHKQELRDRLTAVKHVQIDHFSEHVKVEGYTGNNGAENLFGCDRLLKIETMYSKMQLGYDPNKNKSFLFMNLKTSKYDTINSQYQKEIKEEEMKPLRRNGLQHRMYASKRKADAAVLIEKSDSRLWGETTIKSYYGRENTEALQKNMPFFSGKIEKEKIMSNKQQQKSLQKKIQSNINKGLFQDNIILRKQQIQYLYDDNMLLHFIKVKDAEKKYFFRKLNYAFDIQKNEMFEYYKNRKSKDQNNNDVVNEQPAEDDENND